MRHATHSEIGKSVADVDNLSTIVDGLEVSRHSSAMQDGATLPAREAIADQRRNSRSEYARLTIEEMIVSGQLAAGHRLHEAGLAAMLGVSRGPIREALRALESERLVTGTANQGVFVRHLDVEEAAEIYDVRAAVFGLACERLAERIVPEQLAHLRNQVSAMADAIAAGEGERYYTLNLAFHDAVLQFAGHGRAEQVYRSVLKELHLLRRRALATAARMRASNDEHIVLIDALAAQDASAARTLGEAHAQGGKRRWIESLAR